MENLDDLMYYYIIIIILVFAIKFFQTSCSLYNIIYLYISLYI